MAISQDHFKQIAALAYLDVHDAETLLSEANAILNQIETLHQIDTTTVEPLLHPVHIQQHLRADVANTEPTLLALAQIAPCFEDGYYLVPSVLRGK